MVITKTTIQSKGVSYGDYKNYLHRVRGGSYGDYKNY